MADDQGPYYVCAGEGHFADDVSATCALCSRGIVHRPHAPAGSVKICCYCGVEILRAQGTRGDVRVTEQTLAEFRLYRAPTGNGNGKH